MLRFAQHDRPKVALRAVCHSERERGIQCVDASLRSRRAQHDRMRMANLTLWSLSFNKERDISATPKQGEVKQYGQKHKGQIMNLPLLLTLHL